MLIEGVSSVTWTFHRRAGDWLDNWPQPAIPTVAALPGQPVVTPLPTPAEGVVAVAVDVSLNGFDGRPGSTLRRVQCVHCKGVTEAVRTDPFVCSHCGLSLYVRDHYSRCLAAFQGVCIDAEEPGNIPQPVEKFA